MLQVEPIIGTIYLYKEKKTEKSLYIGQSYIFEQRDKDHFKQKKTTADRRLQEIGRVNIDTIILHQKTFNEFENNKENREAYQLWANTLEILEIEKYNTHNNGLNGTTGGQHDNKMDAYIEFNHKKSFEFFSNFIQAAKIYNEKENSILGACPRTYIVEEMDNYKLGEELHKFRGNSYPTIWAIKENVDLLNEVGYTKTSLDAGVIASERWGKSRIDKKWGKIIIILEWVYNKYGHINLTQGDDNPDDFPEHLLDGLNYTKIYLITCDLRRGLLIGDNVERKNYINTLNFYNTEQEFWDHKLITGLTWYYENEKFSFPQQSYKIPETANLAKYMFKFNLGSLYHNRKREKTIPHSLKELINRNKDKPRPKIGDAYAANPEKKELMAKKCKESWLEKDPIYFKLRSWQGILKKIFKPLKITDLKNGPAENYSKQYRVSQNYFTFEGNSNTNYFRVSKYKSVIECYNAAREYKISVIECYNVAREYNISGFYARKWYIKTFIKKLNQLILEKEQSLQSSSGENNLNFDTINKPIPKIPKQKNQKIQKKWTENYSKFYQYFELNKKIPSERSKNKEEKNLGSWYRNQLHTIKINPNYQFKITFENLLKQLKK